MSPLPKEQDLEKLHRKKAFICDMDGVIIAPLELATNSKAYFIGKPNPLIMRNALKKLACSREETAIIDDRMDTDIIAGIES